MKQKIILFASGNGTNAENICHFFEHVPKVEIAGVYTNNSSAGVIQRLESLGLQAEVFDRNAFQDGTLLSRIQCKQPTLIVLAGFLWKIGQEWVRAFPDTIVNIHPALLPKYGGKGMYYVNEAYDEGAIIFQKKVSLHPNDSTEDIAAKVHQLEYTHFPKVIHSLLNKDAP